MFEHSLLSKKTYLKAFVFYYLIAKGKIFLKWKLLYFLM